ncbi:hypothetical protein BDZ85DRAFT_6016 [Elsinoe ampelina]|uniref:JmjC domain-containing protein n=1 Tax=Elsinoe ampelina TaxID=302913 RepID=A0A6A6GPN1_9PEZI|nr:hypothetical protein BDZ85DRAFT_6016 [Elsinoe ampelina]
MLQFGWRENDSTAPANTAEALHMSHESLGMFTNAKLHYNGVIVVPSAGHAPVYDSTEEIFDHFASDDIEIDVQVEETLFSSECRATKMRTKHLRHRLLSGDKFAINSLNLVAPKQNIRPPAMDEDDCLMYSALNTIMFADGAGRTNNKQCADLERWTLVGHGALTSPHTDSHGLSTFLTINVSQVLFFYLPHPSASQIEHWIQHPNDELLGAGDWRYVLLKRGTTIYFPAGTIHAVARLRAGPASVITGGYVMRRSEISSFARICRMQNTYDYVTNEECLDIREWLWAAAVTVTGGLTRPDYPQRFDGLTALAEFWAHAEAVDDRITAENAMAHRDKNWEQFHRALRQKSTTTTKHPSSRRNRVRTAKKRVTAPTEEEEHGHDVRLPQSASTADADRTERLAKRNTRRHVT